MLRWMTAGESHGPALVALVDGAPQGVRLTTDDLAKALARRRLGHGRGARQSFEKDLVRIIGGVRHGLTTGAPIAVEIANSEWPKWQTVMSPDPVDPAALLIDAGTGDEREIARNRPLTRPRPGHADLAGMLSYDLPEARPVLERASARETAARVALGAIAEAILEQVAGIRILSHVLAVGPLRASEPVLPGPDDLEALDASPMRTLDPALENAFIALIDETKKAGDTIGGVAEVVAWGVPVGLGTHVAADRRLDARLAAALMSIQSVKGVEIGDGFAQAALPGSLAHDEIIKDSRTGHLTRTSNRAGGIEGGTSNGQAIIVRAAFKPISTVPHALRSVDLATGEEARGLHQRSDTCQVVPGAVIAQAEVALVLADALFAHAGGNSVSEMRRNLAAYLAAVEARA